MFVIIWYSEENSSSLTLLFHRGRLGSTPGRVQRAVLILNKTSWLESEIEMPTSHIISWHCFAQVSCWTLHCCWWTCRYQNWKELSKPLSLGKWGCGCVLIRSSARTLTRGMCSRVTRCPQALERGLEEKVGGPWDLLKMPGKQQEDVLTRVEAHSSL